MLALGPVLDGLERVEAAHLRAIGYHVHLETPRNARLAADDG